MTAREYNFDGIIGPTHNYAGLSFGNLASATHQNQPSQPRAAALQGLEKMKTLAALGIGQCLLPPLHRPNIQWLREIGFCGKTDSAVVQAAWKVSPVLVATCFSAASMWTANAATVSPSTDCADGRLHFTPANLSSTLHRSLESRSTTRLLRAIFAAEDHFCVHDPFSMAAGLADEGAANHTRICVDYDQPGIEIFVYGHNPLDQRCLAPKLFPARQTRLASESIARRHQLDSASVCFWQQHPDAIDAGVFHNDVISVGNQNVLLAHESAFLNQAQVLGDLQQKFAARFSRALTVIEFSNTELPLADAVRSYLFNSQLVTRDDGGMTLVCPIESEENESARRCTERILEEPNTVDEVKFLNLRQSMNNGGGPACLRLRVVLDRVQHSKIHPGVIVTETLADRLESWIKKHYRETLAPDDLCDPKLIDESLKALESLAEILDLSAEVLLD